LKCEYDRYTSNIEIPPGIGRNTPLNENIFAIITAIMNDLPIIITGKPGSSKTLAVNLVLKSMKGTSSRNEFFRQYPNLL
jgi:Cdc6-like AAA superfamily ATPase